MKKLKTFANKRFRKLIDHLKSYQHIQDPEVLHKIRVEIKQIKVLLNLIHFGFSKFKSHHHFLPLRTVFRQAGEIRQLDVFYKLLLQYQIAGVADTQIPNADKFNTLSTTFQKEVPQFIKMVKTAKKHLLKFYPKINKRDAKSYLKKQKRELKQMLFPRLSKRTLHKSRKVTKEIICLQWLDNHSEAYLFYNEVENIIGHWNDKQVLIPVLKKANATDDLVKLQELSKLDISNLRNKVSQHYQ